MKKWYCRKEGSFWVPSVPNECESDRLGVMLVLVHIDITPPHTPLPVFRRIGERTLPYSWRAYGATTVAREGCGSFARAGSSMKEGRIQSGYLPFRTRVLYRPRQNDRLEGDVGTRSYRYHTAIVQTAGIKYAY
ncbi:hypothetical protein TNCV_164201 [Trichonephila clavipes]|nr:hypothetical protein TNCV_164201 [Trichonephila clavipes]